jgi:NitT/TauT family transport system ATP-binding protein
VRFIHERRLTTTTPRPILHKGLGRTPSARRVIMNELSSSAIESPAFVELRDVSLSYAADADSILALDNLSLTVGKGQFIAVVGPSGCGKSTLMKVVTGLVLPSRGTVKVGGEAVTGPVKNVGMAFQNATLLPWRTIRDNVLLPFEIIRPHRHKLRAERTYYVGLVQRLLNTVGLAGFSEKYSWQLSGGMQQRANLCRAIVHQPSLLMLDEPFASLDAFTREELWFVMQELWMDRKFTAILVTHDLREAVLLADRVIVFSPRPGRIIYETDVVLPRPRTLQTTYSPLFTDLVHDLREKIRPGRPI